MFRRGELKQAVVAVLAVLGEAHGYAIMAELRERIGGGWQPSPGAIYPALLSLEELGLVRSSEQEGMRMYSLTEEGLRAAASDGVTGAWAALAERARAAEPRQSVGSALDRFATSFSQRRRLMDEDQARRVEQALARAATEIELALETGGQDG